MAMLSTGNGEIISTLSYPVSIPGGDASPRLEFVFGFGTAEIDTPGTFIDSLSATLQNSVAEHTALLVVADRFGPAWAPPNPGGLVITQDDIARQEIGFDAGHGVFGVAYAYTASWWLPREWWGASGELLFDLFDNQNEFASLAYFGGITVVGAPLPTVYTLQSSASPQGPYATENDVVIDEVQQVVRVPRLAPRRFFRVSGNAETRLLSISTESDRRILRYDFVPPRVFLQVASTVTGPFATADQAVVDLGGRLISLPLGEAPQFFRLEANAEVRIVGADRAGDLFVVRFEFEPTSIGLQSSAQPEGPFADEQRVDVDLVNGTFAVSLSGASRYFRFAPGDSRRLTGIRIEGDEIVMDYEVIESIPGMGSPALSIPSP